MKTAKRILEILPGGMVGVYIGFLIADVLNYHRFAALYAADSAPWYTGILVGAVFLAAALAVWSVIYALVHYRVKKNK
ncbi:MAG: hypothetical protein ACI4GO_08685 [Hominenteromicrobium sp.]